MPRKRTTTTQAAGANGARAKSRLPKGLKNSDLVDYYTRLVQARTLDARVGGGLAARLRARSPHSMGEARSRCGAPGVALRVGPRGEPFWIS